MAGEVRINAGALRVDFSKEMNKPVFKATGPTVGQAAWGMVTTLDGLSSLNHIGGLVSKLFGKYSSVGADASDVFKKIGNGFENIENGLAGPGAIESAIDAAKDIGKLAKRNGKVLDNSLSLGSNVVNCAKKVSKFIKWLTTVGAFKLSVVVADAVKYGGKCAGVIKDSFNLSIAIKALVEGKADMSLATMASHAMKIAVAVTSGTFAVFTILAGLFAMTATWVTIGVPVSLTLMIAALTVSGLCSVHAKREESRLAAESVNQWIDKEFEGGEDSDNEEPQVDEDVAGPQVPVANVNHQNAVGGAGAPVGGEGPQAPVVGAGPQAPVVGAGPQVPVVGAGPQVVAVPQGGVGHGDHHMIDV